MSNQNIDINKIIKRLELIKKMIELEDEIAIKEQLEKLKQMQLPDDMRSITSTLRSKSYSKAVDMISDFFSRHSKLEIYSDFETERLKFEVKLLEVEIGRLSEEKAEVEKLIHDFGVMHNKELGSLILKLLQYKKGKAKGTPKESEAERDYNEFSKDYALSKNETINELNDDEKAELKQKYRKASKLCHPDVVDAEQKELAEKIFAELNSAYKRNDLEKVKEILRDLEKGNFFVWKSETINAKQQLISEVEKLRIRIKYLQNELQAIMESEVYKTISNILNWDSYFENSKLELSKQIREFENGN